MFFFFFATRCNSRSGVIFSKDLLLCHETIHKCANNFVDGILDRKAMSEAELKRLDNFFDLGPDQEKLSNASSLRSYITSGARL
jgi:hypothetical protein